MEVNAKSSKENIARVCVCVFVCVRVCTASLVTQEFPGEGDFFFSHCRRSVWSVFSSGNYNLTQRLSAPQHKNSAFQLNYGNRH